MSLIDAFESSIGGLSPSTRLRYRQVVENFIETVGRKRSYGKEDVLRYMAALSKKSGGTYQAFCFSVLKTFFESNRWEWWPRREEKRIKPKHDEPKMPYLKQDSIERMLEAIDSKPPMIQALIRISVLRPTRRIELHRMNREDYTRPMLRIKTAKGGVATTLSLDEKTCNLLDEYLATRKDSEPALFISSKGKRISISALSKTFKNTLVDLGLYRKGMGWHGMRRGVTTLLFKAGLKERELQEYGGWTSPFMPHRYIQLEGTEVDEKVRQRHPLIRRTTPP
jgi:integrase